MKKELKNRLKVYLNDTYSKKELKEFNLDELKQIFADYWAENIYFIFNDTKIDNPFLDETGRLEVNPFKYYKI